MEGEIAAESEVRGTDKRSVEINDVFCSPITYISNLCTKIYTICQVQRINEYKRSRKEKETKR